MRCPGCNQQAISVGLKLRVALRANVRCPACGVAIRFGWWSRAVHTVVGDLALLAGLASSLYFQTPVAFLFATASWFGFALAIPASACHPGRSPAPPAA